MSALGQQRTLSKCPLCAARDVKWNMELTGVPIRFRLEARPVVLNSHRPQSEYIMNIFYIIGVVVVVLFVAGFLGLR
jgi:hypothetical protein